MIFKILNICFSLLFTSYLILINTQLALALTSDQQQCIDIYSTQQTINLANKTITLIGTVMVQHGSINIQADKAIITFLNGKNSYKVIEGYGNPVKFCQVQKNGKLIRGNALKVRYEILSDLLILIGEAYLEQLNSQIKGDHIIYQIKNKKIEIFSDKNKQVTMVLYHENRAGEG